MYCTDAKDGTRAGLGASTAPGGRCLLEPTAPRSGAAVLQRCSVLQLGWLHLPFPTEFPPASLAWEIKIPPIILKLGKDRLMTKISLDLKLKEVLIPLDSTFPPFSLPSLCFWTGSGGYLALNLGKSSLWCLRLPLVLGHLLLATVLSLFPA